MVSSSAWRRTFSSRSSAKFFSAELAAFLFEIFLEFAAALFEFEEPLPALFFQLVFFLLEAALGFGFDRQPLALHDDRVLIHLFLKLAFFLQKFFLVLRQARREFLLQPRHLLGVFALDLRFQMDQLFLQLDDRAFFRAQFFNELQPFAVDAGEIVLGAARVLFAEVSRAAYLQQIVFERGDFVLELFLRVGFLRREFFPQLLHRRVHELAVFLEQLRGFSRDVFFIQRNRGLVSELFRQARGFLVFGDQPVRHPLHVVVELTDLFERPPQREFCGGQIVDVFRLISVEIIRAHVRSKDKRSFFQKPFVFFFSSVERGTRRFFEANPIWN